MVVMNYRWATWVLLVSGCGFAATTDAGDWVSEGVWPRGPDTVAATPRLQSQKAKRFADLGDVRQAAEQYRRLADQFPESAEAEEALILSARNFFAAGEYNKSRDQLEELRRRYVHPTYLDAMGQVEVSLARGYLEGKGEGGTYKLKSRIRKAVNIFKHVMEEDPEGRWADDALLGLGQCEEALGDWSGAITYYKKLLRQYPNSELRGEADGRIAYCIMRRDPRPQYTESEAKDVLQRISQAKEDAQAGDVDLDLAALKENERMLKSRMAQKRFEQARFYAVNKHYRAAEVYYELIKERYAETPWAKKAEEELLKLRQR
jgi:outer membrane protein assembly factor BamD (BamD/ComL family)